MRSSEKKCERAAHIMYVCMLLGGSVKVFAVLMLWVIARIKIEKR